MRILFLLLLLGLLPWDMAPAQAREATDAAADSSAVPTALERRLKAQGFELGTPAFIRIFKESATLELWLWRGGRYYRFKNYKICKWSGELGPKLAEGDRQSPEGVYFISGRDLVINSRWHRAMNLGFPNSRDRALGLTGGGILIHGKCSSTGCFSMTDPVVEEVYEIIAAALDAGQPRVTVNVFPFPLTRANLARHADDDWIDFWTGLKRGHDLFLRDGLPPRTYVCGGEYAFQSRTARRVPLGGNKVCTPLRKPAVSVAGANAKLPSRAQRAQTAEERAKVCDPKRTECRLLRDAIASNAPCPRKYARCRVRDIAVSKSIECPLKFPRCRKGRAPASPMVSKK
ncbi:murein L,D-transpeptidase family protein [Rhodomicrobium sp. R_RK_3]|nr:murein L,D-transpeptidase family protein [Rhodomicrobium sp. R_RK_3]